MNQANVHYNKGNRLRAEGKDLAAIREFEKAFRLNPSFLLAKKSIDFLKTYIEKKCISFGNLYASEGNSMAALEEFKKASEVNPMSWRIYKKMGILYLEKKRYADALRVLKKALALSPQTPQLYVLVGILYDHQEKFKEALTTYAKGLSISPHHPDLVKQKKLTKKLESLWHARQLKDTSPLLYIDIAHLFLEKDMPEKAIHILKKGLSSFPESQEICFTLGNMYYGQDKFKMAYRYYTKTLHTKTRTIHPEEIHYNIGLTLAAQKKWREAITTWRYCIDIAPRSKAALRAKSNLDIIRKKKFFAF